MSEPTLHITFGASGGGALREALLTIGRPDRVVAMFDDFSLGPISTFEPEPRLAWLGANIVTWRELLSMPVIEIPGAPPNDLASEMHAFWRRALARDRRKVAWISQRSASEYAGYLAWLSRMGEAECEIVDVTEIPSLFRSRDGAVMQRLFPLGMRNPDEILEGRLLERAAPLTPERRAAEQDLWRRLQAENAPVRTNFDGELTSVAMDHFDERLLSYCDQSWRKAAYVVGHVLVEGFDEGVWGIDDGLLFSRIAHLVETGALVADGDGGMDIRKLLLRRPLAKAG